MSVNNNQSNAFYTHRCIVRVVGIRLMILNARQVHMILRAVRYMVHPQCTVSMHYACALCHVFEMSRCGSRCAYTSSHACPPSPALTLLPSCTGPAPAAKFWRGREVCALPGCIGRAGVQPQLRAHVRGGQQSQRR